MALFKIFKGNNTAKITNSSATGYITPTDGYAYYDTSSKLFYIDAAYSGTTISRQPINADNAANGVFYGTCPTAQGTKAKVATLTNGTGFSLKAGTIVAIKFTYASAASTMTLNVNSTGAKNLYQYGSTLMNSGTTTTGWPAGAVVPFVYDGTYWFRLYWTNTGTVTSITPGNGLLNGTGTSAITTTGTLNLNYGTSASAIGTTSAAGSANTVSRSDHVHSITLATGDNNGQVKIAGQNVDVKGLGSNAYTSTAYAPLASPALTGTPTAPTPAATSNDTTIATTAFVMNAFTANDAMVFKGVINANEDLPTTHKQGWTYRVATAGTYAGKVCEVGDMIVCVTDGTAANNDHWAVIQNNVDGAVYRGTNAFTDANVIVADSTNGKVKSSGKTITTTAPSSSAADTTIPTSKAVWSAISGASGYGKTGTVTSVRVQATAPIVSSSSAAATTSLNTTISLAATSANYVIAGPTSGTATAIPTYRKLVAADIPSLTKSKISDFPTNISAFTNDSGYVKSSGVTSITLKAGTGISLDTDNTAITTTGTRTITNTGVRATTINGNYLRVNTNGTNADLTIPYATKAEQDADGFVIPSTYVKLVAGTSIPATSATHANLNATNWQKTGSYCVSLNANIPYVDNLPSDYITTLGGDQAFMMNVYSPLSSDGTTTSGNWLYRIQEIIPYSNQIYRWRRLNYTNGSGTWVFGNWTRLVLTDTNTVTTVTTTGSGNAITAISASNGAITATKGSTFLTSHQDISGKADKSATVSTLTWDSTNKKITKTINGTTSDVVQFAAGSNVTLTGASGKLTIAATNSDTKVTQAAVTTNNGDYPVLLGYNTGTTAVTNTVNKASTLTYNPSSKQLKVPSVICDNARGIADINFQSGLTINDQAPDGTRTKLYYDGEYYYSRVDLNESFATLEIAGNEDANNPGSYVCAYTDKAKIGLQDSTGSSIEVGSTLKINDGTGVGSSGQVLMSNGTKTYWGDITAGAGGNAKIFYGTCSTAAATTAKEVTCADFTSADLVKGAIIYVTFTIKNTGTQSSLTLNVNSTGGKPIKHLRNGSIYNIPGAGYLLADQTYRFTYDGTNWVTDMEYDSGNSLQRTYRSSTNVELPIAAISTTGSATAAYSAISSGSYKDVYAAIPNTDANRVMFNPSTGLVTFGQNGLKTSKIQAPTTAGGSSYGAGSSGQALMSNGSTVYWGTPTSDINLDYGETLPSSASEGDIFFQLSNINANTSTITADKINTTAATSNTNYYLVGAVAAGEQSPYISTANSSGTSNTAGVYFNGATGVLSGAAWNDYAEFREKRNIDGIPYGFCVIENGDDTVSFSTKRLQPCGQIVSDTYGFTLGKEENNLPIAVCGRVLAYPYEDRKTFFVGDAVCTAPDGKISKMTREEIKEYPDRIIGYVSSIPNYQVWGDQKIQVKGRIWIKVK